MTFIFAFIDDIDDFVLGIYCALYRQVLVDFEMLFAMQHFDVVNAGLRVRHPWPGMAQYDRHRRKRLQTVFVDIFQFRRIGRIEAEPEAQRINDRVPHRIGFDDLVEGPVQNLVVAKSHRRLPVPA